MSSLFGTDGVRGIVGKELNIDLAMKLGVSTAKVLKRGEKVLTFLVGCDTRISKDVLKNALIAGVLSENANIIDLGVIPTPAVSYLIKKYHADGGFVISASHNPSEYNGIKVFNHEGFKLDDELEEKIEENILNNFSLSEEINKVGTYKLLDTAKKDYVEYLISTVKSDFKNLSIAVDVANGASYETAKMLFEKIGLDYHILNNEPDGLNINFNSGSTNLEGLKKYVVENKLDCGVAFDGDADRCILIDENGNVVDGDNIIAIYGNYLKKQNKLKNNTIVGTIMSNLGLVKFCEKNDINFIATKVGDRYVLESMLNGDYIIGGEQSGHIIFKEYANTGDGELTALQILNIMSNTGKKLSVLSNDMEKYPQVLKNVTVSKKGKETYKDNKIINDYIYSCEKNLNRDVRIVVRPSGTENLIRVMLEGKNLEEITSICDDLAKIIDKELN